MNEETIHLFLKALASEKRQQIMFLFKDHAQLTVNEIAQLLDIGQSTASEHLAVLKRAGLLSSEKKGKEVFYYPNCAKVQLLLTELSTFLTSCCQLSMKKEGSER